MLAKSARASDGRGRFVYAAALLLECAALIALRLHEPKMKRPVRVPGGWFGLALPAGVLALALYSTYVEEGWSAIWMSAAAIATGPLLYPFLVRFVKKNGPTGAVEVEYE